MNTRLFPANERGTADFGWLKANYSFSFANYQNPEMMQFGVLRVLNDDTIAPGAGFGTHPHDNMEIITIALEGGLKHEDSLGSEGVITFGEVQVMSAGSGVRHSEKNASSHDVAKIIQIWIFPEKQDVKPRYEQKAFDFTSKINNFVNVVSPHDQNDGEALWIYQQAFASIGIFEAGQNVEYNVKIKGNGIYIFLLEGQLEIDGQTIKSRDAFGAVDTDEIDISVAEKSKILLMEVPMKM